MTLEISRDQNSPRHFTWDTFGVWFYRDSQTGKQRGDVELFPWSRVQGYNEFRVKV